MLLQRLIGVSGTITTRLELSGMADGQQAGLCCFGNPPAWLMVEQMSGQCHLRVDGEIKSDGPKLDWRQTTLWLRMTHQDDKAQFAFSLDGMTFTPIGQPFTLTRWNWLGARPGLFSTNPDGSAGFVDVDWFHYDYR